MTTRIARLRERLEEPLLVTNLVNIRYLCGFDSSNAALLVEQERVRLFTDFRYIHSAHEVVDVEVVETRRSLVAHLAELLTGRVAFETVLPYAQYETLASGGLELVPRAGVVEALRAVKDEQELELLRRISHDGSYLAVATYLAQFLDDDAPYALDLRGTPFIAEVRSRVLETIEQLDRLFEKPPAVGAVKVRLPMPAGEAIAKAQSALERCST